MSNYITDIWLKCNWLVLEIWLYIVNLCGNDLATKLAKKKKILFNFLKKKICFGFKILVLVVYILVEKVNKAVKWIF